MTTIALDEIKAGRTIMAGRSTSNRRAAGTVTEVIPGVCIHVDNGVQPSVLWGDFEIVGETSELAPASTAEEGELPPAPTLRRTDSGADYGMPGYPDCDFWERHGIEPVFVATANQYARALTVRSSRNRGDPRAILELLEEADEPATGSAAERAWKRQHEFVSRLITPPPSPKAEPVCPPAPQRPAPVRPSPLVIPTLDDHRGLGVLPGDWIKPDPVLTRQETRRYVVAETERWLTGRICSHAKEIAVADPEPAALDTLVAEGKWPAARLYLVYRGLQRGDVGDIEPPGGTRGYLTTCEASGLELPIRTEEMLHVAGKWAATVCADHLNGYAAGNPLAALAVGFVTTDRLPGGGGGVIADYWNHSPFEALRNAPPLPDTDSDSPVQSEAEEELPLVRPSLDAPLDAIDDAVRAFMVKPMQLTLYGWQWTALVGVVTVYLWFIVLLLGRR